MYDYDDYYGSYPGKKKSRMATAAMVLGIIAIFTSSAFYIALPCGALAIICAILARTNHPMTSRCKAGIICGAVGIVISVIVTVYAMFSLFSTESGRDYLENIYRSYTGDSDFELEEIFPFLGGSDEEEEQEEEEEQPAEDSGSGGQENIPNENPGDSSPGHSDDSSVTGGGFV